MVQDPSPARRLRWAVRGALFLSLLAVILGGMFTVIIGLFTGQLTPDAGWEQWVRVVLPSVLVWGLGALPFGAALGFFASLIWREV
ncbi:MAG: ABC transporter ATP-binding protein [Chloroflexus sp.]